MGAVEVDGAVATARNPPGYSSTRRYRALAPVLAHFVASIGYAESTCTEGFDRCIGTGAITIEINLEDDEYRVFQEGEGTVRHTSGAILVGPTLHATIVDRSAMRRAVSVSFSLGGAAAILGAPVWIIAGQLVGIEELWGRRGAVLRERLLDQPTPSHKLATLDEFLAEQAYGRPRPDGAVRHAAMLLRHGHPVAATADALGLSHRTLTRRFKSETGLAPKQYARGARLHRLIDYINHRDQLDWAEAASVNGYYDQSHLIHDFREFTGLTPNEYQSRENGASRHVAMPASAIHAVLPAR